MLKLKLKKKKVDNSHSTIISNKELEKMLKNEGPSYVKLMYANRIIHMTQRQLNYVFNYKKGGEKVEKSRIQHKQK